MIRTVLKKLMRFSNPPESSPWDNHHFGPPPCYTLESADDVYRPLLDLCFDYFNGTQVQGDIYEFGTYKGYTARLISENMALCNWEGKLHLFDSFEGLEEEWNMNDYNPIGRFSLNKKSPKVLKNVTLIKGKVQSTLENFLKDKKDKKIIFAHMDMDTYTPTKYTLNKIKPFLQKGSVILFDEFYGFPNWQKHEYKALKETFKEEEYKYFAFGNRQVSIEIL